MGNYTLHSDVLNLKVFSQNARLALRSITAKRSAEVSQVWCNAAIQATQLCLGEGAPKLRKTLRKLTEEPIGIVSALLLMLSVPPPFSLASSRQRGDALERAKMHHTSGKASTAGKAASETKVHSVSMNR